MTSTTRVMMSALSYTLNDQYYILYDVCLVLSPNDQYYIRYDIRLVLPTSLLELHTS